ncbi:MAG: hypothetical protein R6W93_15115, partial [Candidatus Limnocylindrales bacterium]
SVYVAKVTFERDELKAHMPGEARVEEASGGAQVIEEMEQKRDDLEQQPSDDHADDQKQSSVQQLQSTGKQPQSTGGQPQSNDARTSLEEDRSQPSSATAAGSSRAGQPASQQSAQRRS